MAEKLRISALGYYGFGNLGDEAVLAGILQSVRQVMGETDFTVLTGNEDSTRRLHPGIHTASRWKWREASDRLRGTDLFILGGGSLLQDATSVKSVIWYSLMSLIARRRAKRVIWWGQGIGPLNSGISRRFVSHIAGSADAITVRDPASAELLLNLGVKKNIEVVADPAFALKSPGDLTGIKESNFSANRGNACIIAPRLWKSDQLRHIIESRPDFWERLKTASDGSILFLPMHLPEDSHYIQELPGSTDLPLLNWGESGLSVQDTIAQVSQARCMIAMRLHALIFAAISGVPFLALSYDPKVNALAEASGQEDLLLPVELLNAEDLLLTVERMYRSLPERRERLLQFAQQQSEKAIRPAEIARDLFN